MGGSLSRNRGGETACREGRKDALLAAGAEFGAFHVNALNRMGGGHDAPPVIAVAEAANIDDLGKLVVAKIQAVDGITRTLTCPVIRL